MLRNYLMTAVRVLWRERAYAAVNVFGLAVGLAVCLVIGQFVSYQLSFDTFHAKGDRIYRVLRSPGVGANLVGGGEVSAEQTAPLGPALALQLPEVEAAVRFHGGPWERLLQVEDGEGIYERGLLWVDANVFDVFSFELITGDPATALIRPYTMVITPVLAHRLFGETDPLGQFVRVAEQFDYEVTGIVAAPPAHSTVRFTALASFVTQYEEQSMMMVQQGGGWNMWSFPTYALLAPGADAASVSGRIVDVIQAVSGSPSAYDHNYKLQPLSSIYLDVTAPNSLGSGLGTDPRYLFLCSTIAVLILGLAAINYVNLATARARSRSREIGVRKSIGASRTQLVCQLLGEAGLQSLAATALAVALAEAAIPLVPYLAGIEVPGLRWTPSLAVGSIALATGFGLAAGAYPAWIVARYQPAMVARADREAGGFGLRRGLMIAQFTVTAALMTMSLVIWQQLDYIRAHHLGLQPEQVVLIDNRAIAPEQASSFKAALLQDSRIEAVSLSQRVPTGYSGKMGFPIDGFEQLVRMTNYGVDGDFVRTLGMRMVMGRALSDDPVDAQSIVVNEAAVRYLGWDKPLARSLFFNGVNHQIIGVVADFHYESLHSRVEPLYMVQGGGWQSHILVRLRAGYLHQALAAIDDQWAHFAPQHPIRRTFLDDAFARLYDQEQRLARVFTVFFSMAIAVASIGLFGLAAHTAQSRTREIGVRKVFGASVGGIAAMMSRDIAGLVLIAFVLSVPIAWWATDHWLQDFAYHVEVNVGVFLLSGVASLTLALLTVSHQSIRAALSDPIETLRQQ
jgi:putative ABC transport system permease protein